MRRAFFRDAGVTTASPTVSIPWSLQVALSSTTAGALDVLAFWFGRSESETLQDFGRRSADTFGSCVAEQTTFATGLPASIWRLLSRFRPTFSAPQMRAPVHPAIV